MTTQEIFLYVVPVLITAILAVFIQARRSRGLRRYLVDEDFIRMTKDRVEARKELLAPTITLLSRDDVTLRLLEEVYVAPDDYRNHFWERSPDALRANSLAGLESLIRDALRNSVGNDDFQSYKDRLLKLLDEIRCERAKMDQKEPFNDIRDPEKSLLIDIFNELPEANSVVRQKAVQLSNIVKIKHQDIAKLQEENARAASWTKWGTAGTIFFGLLSLILSLLPLWSKWGAP
jgi:hypothetical protein